MPPGTDVLRLTSGEDKVGPASCRHLGGEFEIIVPQRPFDRMPSVRRIVMGPGPGDSATRPRFDARAAPRRLGPPQARDVGVQESDDGALAVVVERRVRHAVLVDAFPTLPHRGRATVEHHQPPRCGALQEQVVCRVEVPAVGESGQQVTGGKEAGAEPGAVVADEAIQLRGSGFAQVIGHEAERQRPHEVGLRVGRDGAVRGDELLLPGGACLVGEVATVPRVRRSAQHLGDGGHGLG